MSDAAWGFFGLVVITLFGAGGFFQWYRTQKELKPVAQKATTAKRDIDALLPIVADLQQRLEDAEDAQVELMILLAAHGEWDMRVLAEIRKFHPDFPDPPPLKRKEIE